MEAFLGNSRIFSHNGIISMKELQSTILQNLNLLPDEYYLLSNGRLVRKNMVSGRIHIILRILGGKGGFGSMLRAIGAQIEKTTNREACRDLSGRRLRDINEEQRLKKWVAQQAEREKEVKEKKKKKLEKMLEQPKHEFHDEEYDKERSALPEKVEVAVLQGLEASCSTKRKTETKSKIVKKKPKLWLDDDLSSSGSETDNEQTNSSSSSSILESRVILTKPTEGSKDEDKTCETNDNEKAEDKVEKLAEN